MYTNTQQPARVAVVGLGAVTSQGPTAKHLWEGVREGRVAIRPVQHLDMEGYRTKIGGEVVDPPLPNHDYPHPEDFRERALDFALVAAEEAVNQAGPALFEPIPRERWGVVMGTCNAGLLSGEKWLLDARAGKEPDRRLLLLVSPQAFAEQVGAAFGLRGPLLSIDTACAAGANAIGYGAELIRWGHADGMLVGGTDAFSHVLFAGFNSLESLSPEPAAPYSKDRQGLSLGEGSGMLVLVRQDVAGELGLEVLAELRGYGLSADGYHPTAPHPEGMGAARAVRAALKSSGVEPDQIGYVNSHGTGTAKNDPAETKATKLGLGDAARRVAVSSTKSMIGHLLGAAGAVEGIVTVKALHEQVAPPTANFTEPDPECDLDYVPNVARPLQTDYAVSNNFAFGGANASIVLARAGTAEGTTPLPDFDRVVVTGIAALTAAGNELEQVYEAFVAGRRVAHAEGGAQLARVQLDASAYLAPKQRRRVDRLGLFAVISSKLALADAALEATDENRERVGVLFGTGIGPMDTMEQFAEPLFDEGARAANPAVFPNTVYNAAGGQVAMVLGLVGSATTVTAGHAAGASALCYAHDLLSTDHADAIVCPAADTLTDTVVRAYRQLGVVAGDDRAEGGFILAEAGVALVLERLSSARQRGARIYGELLGYGIASDGLPPDTEGSGIERALRVALERAQCTPGDVSTVWLNEAGFGPADAAERAAMTRVFGEGSDGGPEFQAPKKLLGEPIGAGGSLTAALALEALRRGDRQGIAVVNSSSQSTHFSMVFAPWRP